MVDRERPLARRRADAVEQVAALLDAVPEVVDLGAVRLPVHGLEQQLHADGRRRPRTGHARGRPGVAWRARAFLADRGAAGGRHARPGATGAGTGWSKPTARAATGRATSSATSSAPTSRRAVTTPWSRVFRPSPT